MYSTSVSYQFLVISERDIVRAIFVKPNANCV